MDIIERLLEDALHHDDVATQCDCAPEHTVNHDHALNAREAAEDGWLYCGVEGPSEAPEKCLKAYRRVMPDVELRGREGKL